MIITTADELRLYIPNHAIDEIQTMAGFFDASEHDTLTEKIGYDLYQKVVAHYATLDTDAYIQNVANSSLTAYYDRLLNLCQRIVAFDAMRSAVGTMTLSVNGAGINIQTAEDYGKPDKDAIEEFKQTCNTNLHKSINVLLQTLEQWVQEYNENETTNSDTNETTNFDTNETEDSVSSDSETEEKAALTEIVTLWQTSRYYYLTAALLIPCATVLQEYLNFYENREKFIQMLPDLRYIQEDILSDCIGEDLIDWFVSQVNAGTTDKPTLRMIHKLRKAMATHLEARTNVLSVPNDRRQRAHDEAINLLSSATEYIDIHQGDLPDTALDALKLSPLYKPTDTEEETARKPYKPKFQNNRPGNAIFVMPGLR